MQYIINCLTNRQQIGTIKHVFFYVGVLSLTGRHEAWYGKAQ